MDIQVQTMKTELKKQGFKENMYMLRFREKTIEESKRYNLAHKKAKARAEELKGFFPNVFC